jgi:toxin ParE1/3/4
LAQLFETIATMPTLARERAEFTPPVRVHRHEAHVIVYTVAADHVVQRHPCRRGGHTF